MVGALFNKEAIAQAAKEAQHEHGVGIPDVTTVVVQRYVQALVSRATVSDWRSVV